MKTKQSALLGGAVCANSFTMNWANLTLYAFLPFSVIDHVLQELKAEGAHGLLVIPYCPTQPWFPKAMKMCV